MQTNIGLTYIVIVLCTYYTGMVMYNSVCMGVCLFMHVNYTYDHYGFNRYTLLVGL